MRAIDLCPFDRFSNLLLILFPNVLYVEEMSPCLPHLVCSMEQVKEPDVGAVILVELEMVVSCIALENRKGR
jgi:hypothetical protein